MGYQSQNYNGKKLELVENVQRTGMVEENSKNIYLIYVNIKWSGLDSLRYVMV